MKGECLTVYASQIGMVFVLFVTACTTGQSPGSLAPPPPGGGKANPATNKPPQISGDIEVQPAYITPGQQALARVRAMDPDKGDKLSYDWIVTGGTILEGGDTEVVKWAANETVQRVTLKVIVKDTNSAFAEKSKTVDLTRQFVLFDVPPKPKYEKGSVMPLKVYAQSIENLMAFGFQLRFDSKRLDLLSVNAAPALGKEPIVLIQQDKPGEIALGFVKTSGPPMKGNMEIATIAFQATEDIPAEAGVVITIVPGTDFPTAKGPDGKELPVGYRFGGKPVIDQLPAEAATPAGPSPSPPPPPEPPPAPNPPESPTPARPSPEPNPPK
ncbi:MAG: cohesin domain-containing protein [bacterium JZ-2024 1]